MVDPAWLSRARSGGGGRFRGGLTDGRSPLLRRGLRLEYPTLGWNVVGVVVWELTAAASPAREQRALRLIGIAFVALAVYVAGQALFVFASKSQPDTSVLGIGWTAMTCAVTLSVAAGKARTGRTLGNPVLVTEGRVTMIDAYLAGSVLAGLVLNAVFGLWRAYPSAGFVVMFCGATDGGSARAARS